MGHIVEPATLIQIIIVIIQIVVATIGRQRTLQLDVAETTS